MKCVKCETGYAYFDVNGEPICVPCFLYEPGLEKPNACFMRSLGIRKTKKPSSPQYDSHRIVAVAKRHGHLQEQSCEICGDTYAIEAHHHDYSKPLEVSWLCGRYHRDVTNGKIVLKS